MTEISEGKSSSIKSLPIDTIIKGEPLRSSASSPLQAPPVSSLDFPSFGEWAVPALFSQTPSQVSDLLRKIEKEVASGAGGSGGGATAAELGPVGRGAAILRGLSWLGTATIVYQAWRQIDRLLEEGYDDQLFGAAVLRHVELGKRILAHVDISLDSVPAERADAFNILAGQIGYLVHEAGNTGLLQGPEAAKKDFDRLFRIYNQSDALDVQVLLIAVLRALDDPGFHFGSDAQTRAVRSFAKALVDDGSLDRLYLPGSGEWAEVPFLTPMSVADTAVSGATDVYPPQESEEEAVPVPQQIHVSVLEQWANDWGVPPSLFIDWFIRNYGADRIAGWGYDQKSQTIPAGAVRADASAIPAGFNLSGPYAGSQKEDETLRQSDLLGDAEAFFGNYSVEPSTIAAMRAYGTDADVQLFALTVFPRQGVFDQGFRVIFIPPGADMTQYFERAQSWLASGVPVRFVESRPIDAWDNFVFDLVRVGQDARDFMRDHHIQGPLSSDAEGWAAEARAMDRYNLAGFDRETLTPSATTAIAAPSDDVEEEHRLAIERFINAHESNRAPDFLPLGRRAYLTEIPERDSLFTRPLALLDDQGREIWLSFAKFSEIGTTPLPPPPNEELAEGGTRQTNRRPLRSRHSAVPLRLGGSMSWLGFFAQLLGDYRRNLPGIGPLISAVSDERTEAGPPESPPNDEYARQFQVSVSPDAPEDFDGLAAGYTDRHAPMIARARTITQQVEALWTRDPRRNLEAFIRAYEESRGSAKRRLAEGLVEIFLYTDAARRRAVENYLRTDKPFSDLLLANRYRQAPRLIDRNRLYEQRLFGLADYLVSRFDRPDLSPQMPAIVADPALRALLPHDLQADAESAFQYFVRRIMEVRQRVQAIVRDAYTAEAKDRLTGFDKVSEAYARYEHAVAHNSTIQQLLLGRSYDEAELNSELARHDAERLMDLYYIVALHYQLREMRNEVVSGTVPRWQLAELRYELSQRIANVLRARVTREYRGRQDTAAPMSGNDLQIHFKLIDQWMVVANREIFSTLTPLDLLQGDSQYSVLVTLLKLDSQTVIQLDPHLPIHTEIRAAYETWQTAELDYIERAHTHMIAHAADRADAIQARLAQVYDEMKHEALWQPVHYRRMILEAQRIAKEKGLSIASDLLAEAERAIGKYEDAMEKALEVNEGILSEGMKSYGVTKSKDEPYKSPDKAAVDRVLANYRYGVMHLAVQDLFLSLGVYGRAYAARNVIAYSAAFPTQAHLLNNPPSNLRRVYEVWIKSIEEVKRILDSTQATEVPVDLEALRAAEQRWGIRGLASCFAQIRLELPAGAAERFSLPLDVQLLRKLEENNPDLKVIGFSPAGLFLRFKQAALVIPTHNGVAGDFGSTALLAMAIIYQSMAGEAPVLGPSLRAGVGVRLDRSNVSSTKQQAQAETAGGQSTVVFSGGTRQATGPGVIVLPLYDSSGLPDAAQLMFPQGVGEHATGYPYDLGGAYLIPSLQTNWDPGIDEFGNVTSLNGGVPISLSAFPYLHLPEIQAWSGLPGSGNMLNRFGTPLPRRGLISLKDIADGLGRRLFLRYDGSRAPMLTDIQYQRLQRVIGFFEGRASFGEAHTQLRDGLRQQGIYLNDWIDHMNAFNDIMAKLKKKQPLLPWETQFINALRKNVVDNNAAYFDPKSDGLSLCFDAVKQARRLMYKLNNGYMGFNIFVMEHLSSRSAAAAPPAPDLE